MSSLKRTRENFPKMKVRGARRKWEAQLDRLIQKRTDRFNLAMRLLGESANQAGMAFTVMTNTLKQFEEANKHD